MTRKKVPECAVCHKVRSTECAHVDCPNRKRITATVGSASGYRFGNTSYFSGQSQTTGSFRKGPKQGGGE